MRTSPAQVSRQTWVVFIVSVLMLGALLLRVQAVWHRIPQGPEGQAFLVGDEIAYEKLADGVLRGLFFPSPVWYFTQRALRSSWAKPGVYLTYALQKAGYLWLGKPDGRMGLWPSV